MADETGRLAALQRYKILETPPEGALDDLTRLAADVCRTPVAFLTLIDSDRQWFKSRIGLAVAETARDIAFCGHAIQGDGPLVVADTRRDERFADNPLVLGDPHLRFYAGMPLRTPDGFAIGTLAVADTVPRQLDDAQLRALRVLAAQAMAQLELRRQALEAAGGAGRVAAGAQPASARDPLLEQSVQLDAAPSAASSAAGR